VDLSKLRVIIEPIKNRLIPAAAIVVLEKIDFLQFMLQRIVEVIIPKIPKMMITTPTRMSPKHV
jgi:hypothetical protein